MNKMLLSLISVIFLSIGFMTDAYSAQSVTVHVKNAGIDKPVKLGIPFPEGSLYSPDNVRVLNSDGVEILSQTTQVTTWEPADPSIKWLWVFFFTDESTEYTVEYGDDVERTTKIEQPIVFKNNQRLNGFAEINTGPMLLRIDKGGSGFIDRVQLDVDGQGFTDDNIVATGTEGRGSFLDYLNDNGTDHSKAVIHQHFIEKGSGPLHAIIKVTGEYEYEDPEHENSPFVTYIHAYAGKSYVKVYHTITYTGKPDKSEPLNGKQHPDIATQTELIIDESVRGEDLGLVEAHDMIKSMGFGLTYNLTGQKKYKTELVNGDWWDNGDVNQFETDINDEKSYSVLQTGPPTTLAENRITSTLEERISDFKAVVTADGNVVSEAQKASGWMSVSDDKFGVSVGIRHMMEEFPNELVVDVETGEVYAYTWSPNVDPMSFERADTSPDGGMVGNFAQGLTKTTETIFYFHDGDESYSDIQETMSFVLNPPVAHADQSWYGKSGVYGNFAQSDNNFGELERGLQYKFQWMLFNQKWEPWYGKFYHGDVMNYFFGEDWVQWANNEPALDYIWWTNFMRTGDVDSYKMAQASSRHSMDVDNTHWPIPRTYRGDTNRSLDYFESAQQEEGSPYLGMGRRHASEQWISMLSAHVWLTGWVSSYYLDGYHRGLEVARLTGDYYLKRVFGDHGLKGRRLYLSIWNLAELYDASKEEKYLTELNERIEYALDFQKYQGGRMVIDRYGYSQNYLSHGFTKYLQMFDRPDIESAYLTHARSLRDVPPIDHDYESYLSSIHPLITAYDLSGDEDFLAEACNRASHLLVDPLPQSVDMYDSQSQFKLDIESVSNLPTAGEGPSFRGRLPIWSISNGMRIFGWTHAFSVPYLIDRLEKTGGVGFSACMD